MTFPLTTINYRLQNVDFLSYIESPSDTSQLQMRPLKDSTRQQWSFSPGDTEGYYYIQNVADPDRYIGSSTASPSNLVAVPLSSSWQWKIEHQSGSYMLSAYNASKNYWPYTSSERLTIACDTTKSGYENRRWNLLPVTTTTLDTYRLPSGYYRIRTFNGVNLLTIPGDNPTEDPTVYIKNQEPDNLYQRWFVTQQENGFYIIQSSGNSTTSYLGCGPTQSAQGDPVSAVSTPFLWNLRSFGPGSAWSISLPTAQLSVGFADYNAASDDDISLIGSDAVPSQMWFFEKFNLLGNDKIHATRLVEEGTYRLQSCHDNSIYMNVSPAPYIITAGAATTKFSLKYTSSTSPRLNISYVISGTNSISAADLGGYLGFSTKPVDWVLLSERKEDPGFYICLSDAGYPRKVISCRQVTDVNGNTDVFAIDNMTSEDEMQMWNFVSVTK